MNTINWPGVVFLIIYSVTTSAAQTVLKTKYFKITIDDRGYITRMENGKRNFVDPKRPSPLLSLYEAEGNKYRLPVSCRYEAQKNFQIKFRNGSTAVVKVETKNDKYFKFTLQSLTGRENIDAVEWGPVYTRINNLFGEIIGVARDTSAAVNFAVGVMALNDATTGGPATTIGDIPPFNYIIHSTDKKKIPLPDNVYEGQYFNLGGDGVSDVAFFSRPEPYFRIVMGNSAIVDSTGNIMIRYHAKDRTKSRMVNFSLLPGFDKQKPSHQELLPLPGVDYIGSSIALWGGPDDIALMEIIQPIVLQENLPYPMVNKRWVKDPVNYQPDVAWYGNYDSAVSYTSQLGFKAIQGEGLGEFYPNRANRGNIDWKLPYSTGKRSIKEFTDRANAKGILLGLHTLNNFLQKGCSDVSPVPSDSLCYLLKRKIVKSVSATDTVIVINEGKYLDEIAGWAGHPAAANIIKIGKELIHYSGVSEKQPFTLKKVTRGYWGTKASAHQAGDEALKLMANCYAGLVPDMNLQEKIAVYYAQLAAVTGMHYIDLDGEEGLYYQGHGNYAAKLFFRKLFDECSRLGVPYLRVMGASVGEGAWHYQSVFNIGGGKNMYDIKTGKWAIEGKDIRDVCVSNYFPATFGINFNLTPASTVQEYENIQALSIGVGVTYMLSLSQKEVEACPKKYEIFRAIRTWENARKADAFPLSVKKELARTDLYFHLEEKAGNSWNLYKVNKEGGNKVLFKVLKSGAKQE